MGPRNSASPTPGGVPEARVPLRSPAATSPTSVQVNRDSQHLQGRSLREPYQGILRAVVTPPAPPVACLWCPLRGPQLRLPAKSQFTGRASSPKVTLGPCRRHTGLSHHFTIQKRGSPGEKDD